MTSSPSLFTWYKTTLSLKWKKYSKKENTILLYFEKHFKYASIIFIYKTSLSGIFPESFQAQNPITITTKYMTERAGRFGASWHDVTVHSWTQTLSCVDSRSSSLGVAKAGTLKLNFGRQTRRNPKILFGVVIYGL